jgi:segregation and condensation protein B
MNQPVDTVRNGKLKNSVECLLFVASEPLSLREIAEALEVDEDAIEDAVDELCEALQQSSGLQVVNVAGGYQLCTRPEYAEVCAKLLHPSNQRLSRAALETLAVVAYRQPVTQPEIEAIRGVSVDGVMKTLLDRGLIREMGRKPTVGRPILYSTTDQFLQHFGLADITDLPDVETLGADEISALEAQRSLFETQEVVAQVEDSTAG